jgi:hypothetical protein
MSKKVVIFCHVCLKKCTHGFSLEALEDFRAKGWTTRGEDYYCPDCRHE